MKISLQLFLGLQSIICLAIGFGMIVYGADSVEALSNNQSTLIDNEFRAFGALLAGYAFLLWWIIPDVESKAVPLAILCFINVLVALARLVSLAEYGIVPNDKSLAIVLGLMGPLVLIWHYFAAKEVAKAAVQQSESSALIRRE